MSQAQRINGRLEAEEKRERAEKYESLIDELLEDGRALAYPQADMDIGREEYHEQSALQKAKTLSDFYNSIRGIEEGSESYDDGEILQHIDLIMDKPESIESSQRNKAGIRIETAGREHLEEKLDDTEYRSKTRSRQRTGSYPSEGEMEQVARTFWTEEEQEDELIYFGVEPRQ